MATAEFSFSMSPSPWIFISMNEAIMNELVLLPMICVQHEQQVNK